MWVNVCFVYSVAVLYLHLCLLFLQFSGHVVQFPLLWHPMVSPWGSAQLSRDLLGEWQLGLAPSQDQIQTGWAHWAPHAKTQRPPSVRWQTSQSCVRNFWSKINGLWFSVVGMVVGVHLARVCWGLIDNLCDFSEDIEKCYVWLDVGVCVCYFYTVCFIY